MNFESLIYRELRSIHESGQTKYCTTTDPMEREFAKGWRDAAVAIAKAIAEQQGVTFHDVMQRVYW